MFRHKALALWALAACNFIGCSTSERVSELAQNASKNAPETQPTPTTSPSRRTSRPPEKYDVGKNASGPEKPPDLSSVVRYPNLEAPDTVFANRQFSLQVSLTMQPLSNSVRVAAGPNSSVDSEGRLSMSLPRLNGEPWKIGVVLNAPGFDIVNGKNEEVIDLPASGDSTPALFRLTPRAEGPASVQGKLSATFWHDGEYLARATRVISVATNGSAPDAIINKLTLAHETVTTVAAEMGSAEGPPDLTLYLQESEVAGRTVCQLTVESP